VRRGHLIPALFAFALASSAQGRTLTSAEVSASDFVQKMTAGMLTDAQFVGITVATRGAFAKSDKSKVMPVDFTGCKSSGVIERKQNYIAPSNAGSLAGQEFVVVDTMLDCSQKEADPHFVRMSIMFRRNRLDMLVIRRASIDG
jgi:hypothetical protein